MDRAGILVRVDVGSDFDTTGWLAGAFAALGGVGGLLRLFTTQSVHGQRLNRLENDRAEHASKIESTHTTVTTLDSKVDHVQSDVSEIRVILESYRDRQ